MKLVQVLETRDVPELIDAHLAYHLNAGVDLVIASDDGVRDETAALLDSYVRDGRVHVVRHVSGEPQDAIRTRMARMAATEFGADWVIMSAANQFWWPRASSLTDVLVAIPARYTIVQALSRRFVAQPDDGRPFWERLTVRRTVHAGRRETARSTLEPVFRADPRIEFGPPGVAAVPRTRHVPLRAWYPIEVFEFPVPGLDQLEGDSIVEDELASALDDGSLVVDTRLRDALNALRIAPEGTTSSRPAFARPEAGVGRLGLRPPDVVDEAAYAVECAEVGEVDVMMIERQVVELERRIAELEARFWPSVGRRLRRLARRPR